jgi:hypothetical protein
MSKTKANVNMIDVSHNEVLAIAHAQAKKVVYTDPCIEKERLCEARAEVKNAPKDSG